MIRLDKYLAHAGIGTRKEVKQWIRKKHVSVNGVICIKDDTHIDETSDEVVLDGERIQYDRVVYIMLHKPDGVVSATSDAQYQTVLECIDTIIPKDCFPVGRLDIDTEGLLLICNDGKLAHALLSPKKHVDKTYYVEIREPLEKGDIELLESGTITLDDEVLKPAKVEVIDETSIYLTIQEGKYHQVKRMLQAVHNEVLFLRRERMGSLVLDTALKPGEWRYLTEEEIQVLKNNHS